MKLIFTLLIFLGCVSNFVCADEGVDITDPEQVSELLGIQKRLDAASTAVMGAWIQGKSTSLVFVKTGN